ncbi:MAG TPA: hypothetical protein VIP77_16065 [Jiangellaceae bacterium]
MGSPPPGMGDHGRAGVCGSVRLAAAAGQPAEADGATAGAVELGEFPAGPQFSADPSVANPAAGDGRPRWERYHAGCRSGW